MGKTRTELVKRAILDREEDESYFVPLSEAEEIEIHEEAETGTAS